MLSVAAPVKALQVARAERIWVGMAAKDKEREERLAAALRENLKRRKQQARATKQAKPEAD